MIFQPATRVQSIGSEQRWCRVKSREPPLYGCQVPGSDLTSGRGSQGGGAGGSSSSSSRAWSSHPAFTPGTRREGAGRLFTAPEQDLTSRPEVQGIAFFRATPRSPCTSLFPGNKNPPSGWSQHLWKFFRPLYTSAGLLRWLQTVLYLLFASISFTGISCRNTASRQERVQSRWKAPCRAASPWMLHFNFWDEFPSGLNRSRKFCVPDTDLLVLHWLSKNASVESL